MAKYINCNMDDIEQDKIAQFIKYPSNIGFKEKDNMIIIDPILYIDCRTYIKDTGKQIINQFRIDLTKKEALKLCDYYKYNKINKDIRHCQYDLMYYHPTKQYPTIPAHLTLITNKGSKSRLLNKANNHSFSWNNSFKYSRFVIPTGYTGSITKRNKIKRLNEGTHEECMAQLLNQVAQSLISENYSGGGLNNNKSAKFSRRLIKIK